MSNRPYSLLLLTPGGKCAAEADTMPALIEITPRGLFGEFMQQPGGDKPQKPSLDEVARDLLTAFFQEAMQHKKSFQQSSISRAGLELELVKCYLNSMTIETAVSHLAGQSSINICKSAVGRYYVILNKIGLDFKARL